MGANYYHHMRGTADRGWILGPGQYKKGQTISNPIEAKPQLKGLPELFLYAGSVF